MPEIRPGVMRTPDEHFFALPGYAFEPNYVEIPSADLGFLRMHYLDEGPSTGPVVLMLHGNPTWSFLYRHLIGPVAAAGYRVIVPDMIGFGRSDKPAARDAYSFDRFVSWMRAFVTALNLKDITLVCQDWGGPIGLRALAEEPERYAAVLAANTLLQNCDPPPLGVPGWPSAQIRNWIDLCKTSNDLPIPELIARATVNPLDKAVLDAYGAPFPDARYKKAVLAITCAIPIEEGAEGLEANRQAWKVLEGFEKPFLTAFSNGDPATIDWETVFQHRVAGANGQPHARIDSAGHFVQEEQGLALAEILIQFLKNNQPSTS